MVRHLVGLASIWSYHCLPDSLVAAAGGNLVKLAERFDNIVVHPIQTISLFVRKVAILPDPYKF